jgi:hypothetical protein
MPMGKGTYGSKTGRPKKKMMGGGRAMYKKGGGVKHYKKDGTEYKGSSHKMPNGELHTNKTHTKTSVKLFHFKDLSKTAKAKAKK